MNKGKKRKEKISQMYPSPWINVYCLQTQLFGIQESIDFLNSINDVHFFIYLGSILFHTTGPKTCIVFSPLTVFTLGLGKIYFPCFGTMFIFK